MSFSVNALYIRIEKSFKFPIGVGHIVNLPFFNYLYFNACSDNPISIIFSSFKFHPYGMSLYKLFLLVLLFFMNYILISFLLSQLLYILLNNFI